MSGLFEHLAMTDETHRVSARKATALARARAEKSFGAFVRSAKTVDDRETRLALVAGDLENMVKQACADADHAAWENVLETVQAHLGFVVEARRPKMCPYHREVMDISLAAGEPQAGFAAMAQHAWGGNHCQGEWEGGCNFKPEMVTQTYWDQKQERADQRRKEREEQRQLELQQQAPQLEEFNHEVDDEFSDVETPMETTDADWADEPSAVGMGSEPAVAEPQMAMAASTRVAVTVQNPLIHGGSLAPLMQIEQRKPGITINGEPIGTFHQRIMGGEAPPADVVDVAHPNPTWQGIAAEILQEGSKDPLLRYFQQKKQQQGGGPAMASVTAAGPTLPDHTGPIERQDVAQGGETPSPKMDKRKWTPENVRFLDNVDSDQGPNPTTQVDIFEPAAYGGDWDKVQQIAGPTVEKQDVTQASGFSADKAHGGSWPEHPRSAISNVTGLPGHPEGCTCEECVRTGLAGAGNVGPGGASALQQRIQQGPPVAAPYRQAGDDPDVNPIRELLEEEEENDLSV
jgi:hypothetical protein